MVRNRGPQVPAGGFFGGGGTSAFGPARPGSARSRLGPDRLGPARPGSVRLGSARTGSDRLGPARSQLGLGSPRTGSDGLGPPQLALFDSALHGSEVFFPFPDAYIRFREGFLVVSVEHFRIPLKHVSSTTQKILSHDAYIRFWGV